MDSKKIMYDTIYASYTTIVDIIATSIFNWLDTLDTGKGTQQLTNKLIIFHKSFPSKCHLHHNTRELFRI